MTLDFEEKPPLDFKTISDELDTALTAVSNQLEREWPSGVGGEDSQVIVIGLFRVSLTSFMATRYLCATVPSDAYRKPEFVITAPPILRSVLDALANIVYLFEDLTRRSDDFSRRGWKEDYDKTQRYFAAYGSDSWWKPYLDQMTSEELRIRTMLGIKNEDVGKLRRWPTLGAMVSKNEKEPDRVCDDDRRALLTYVNDWFYRELSQETHLSPPGLYRRAEVLLVESRLWTDEHRDTIDQLRSDIYMVGMMLLMSIASELQNELRLGLAERLVRLWSRLSLHSRMIEELYNFRYWTLLAGQP